MYQQLQSTASFQKEGKKEKSTMLVSVHRNSANTLVVAGL
jgi:hypothetical protein